MSIEAFGVKHMQRVPPTHPAGAPRQLEHWMIAMGALHGSHFFSAPKVKSLPFKSFARLGASRQGGIAGEAGCLAGPMWEEENI